MSYVGTISESCIGSDVDRSESCIGSDVDRSDVAY
jgi:hypothetical protein